MPIGMRHRTVHHQMPNGDENDHRSILHTISKRTTDQRRSDDRKGQLKRAVNRFRDGGCEVMKGT